MITSVLRTRDDRANGDGRGVVPSRLNGVAGSARLGTAAARVELASRRSMKVEQARFGTSSRSGRCWAAKTPSASRSTAFHGDHRSAAEVRLRKGGWNCTSGWWSGVRLLDWRSGISKDSTEAL